MLGEWGNIQCLRLYTSSTLLSMTMISPCNPCVSCSSITLLFSCNSFVFSVLFLQPIYSNSIFELRGTMMENSPLIFVSAPCVFSFLWLMMFIMAPVNGMLSS